MCVYVDRRFDSLVRHAFICPIGNETTGVRFVRPRHNDCCACCWWKSNTINSTQNTSKIRDLGRSLSLFLCTSQAQGNETAVQQREGGYGKKFNFLLQFYFCHEYVRQRTLAIVSRRQRSGPPRHWNTWSWRKQPLICWFLYSFFPSPMYGRFSILVRFLDREGEDVCQADFHKISGERRAFVC